MPKKKTFKHKAIAVEPKVVAKPTPREVFHSKLDAENKPAATEAAPPLKVKQDKPLGLLQIDEPRVNNKQLQAVESKLKAKGRRMFISEADKVNDKIAKGWQVAKVDGRLIYVGKDIVLCKPI